MGEEPREPRDDLTPDAEQRGREVEVLAARRDSLERLGSDRAFALSLDAALGVDAPTGTASIREALERTISVLR